METRSRTLANSALKWDFKRFDKMQAYELPAIIAGHCTLVGEPGTLPKIITKGVFTMGMFSHGGRPGAHAECQGKTTVRGESS